MHASRWAPQKEPNAFAQTREPDSLFDDDFTPIAEPLAQPAPAAEQLPRQKAPNQRARGNTRARGHGRGGAHSSHQQSSAVSQSSDWQRITPPPPIAATPTEASNPTPEDSTSEGATEPTTAEAPARVLAVRGPRHQTGGIQRPRLSEDELAARMAAVALNNVKREAAHKEAEADVARFEAREEAAKQKRAREMVARQGMDNEREKNRQRKLGAQGIRQWDQGKDDSALSSATTSKGQTSNGHEGAASAQSNKEAGREGYGDPFRSSYRGHISYGRLTSSGYGHQPSGNGSGTNNGSDNSRGAPRGRGRAMGRGQRGSGRGNTNGRPAAVTSGTRVASQPAKEDFPALPANTKPSVPKDGEQALETVVKSDADSHTWADQVEASQ